MATWLPAPIRRGSFRLGSLFAIALSTFACVGSPLPVTLAPETIPAAAVGRYYEVEFTAEGGGGKPTMSTPESFPGLTFVTGSGHALLFGTPLSEGTFTLGVTASVGGPTMFQDAPSTHRDYTLVLEAAAEGNADALAFDLRDPITTNVGGQFSFHFCSEESAASATEAGACTEAASVTGGQPPHQFSFYCVTLADFCQNADDGDRYSAPGEFRITTDGVFSGPPPSEPGRWEFILCVVDVGSQHACDMTYLDLR